MAEDMNVEIWKPIEGWPYEVSDHGRIRRTIPYRNSKPGGIIKTSPSKSTGYPRVTLSKDNCTRLFTVHSLVAAAFLGPKPNGKRVIAHSDGTRTNNAVSNLRWASFKENEADKLLHGRRPQGELVPGAKLTTDQVRSIKQSAGSIHKLAPIYGVCASTIARIRNGQTWGHLR